MEFRYRAGDARDHPQPILGSFIMPDIERATHQFPRHVQMTAAMQRVIWKEIIREKMIARDMAERRILEEEARWETYMEERMGIRLVPLVDPVLAGQHIPKTVFAERDWPRPAAIEYKPKSVLGLKRKAKTNGLGAAQKTYGCSLCHLIATSEKQFEDHLSGKKHKAILAKMSTNKILAKMSTKKMGSTAKASTSKAYAQKAVITMPQTNVTKKVDIMVNGMLSQVIQKDTYLWCMHCKIKCNSTMMMHSHLLGKKHAKRVGLSENGNGPVKTTATTTEDAKSQLAEADVKGKALEVISKEEDASEEESEKAASEEESGSE